VTRGAFLVLAGLLLLAGCAGQKMDGADLIGLGEPAVRQALGQPKRVRREADAQVWQYAGAGCVVDVFLYGGSRGPAVVHVEARDLKGRRSDAGRCLDSLGREI